MMQELTMTPSLPMKKAKTKTKQQQNTKQNKTKNEPPRTTNKENKQGKRRLKKRSENPPFGTCKHGFFLGGPFIKEYLSLQDLYQVSRQQTYRL